MADIGTLEFGVHLKDYTDAEADKIKKKLENLSVHLKIDGKNVTISQTDLIKKQIEDAIKSVSVQSVKIDTNAVRTQVNTALQGINPQVSVSIQKGALSNDLQNYLHTKVFTVGITITRGNAQSAINTAFANISVPVNVTVKASAVAQQLQQSLANAKAKVSVEVRDANAFVADIEKKLKGRNIKVDIEPNRQHLVQAVKQSLQGVSVKAKVDVNVDASAITRAVQSAINNARFTYSPNGRRSQSGGGSRSGNRTSGSSSARATNGLNQTARASVTLGRSLSTNIRLAGELGSTLGNIASLFKVKEILEGVVRIGGQLENQKIALGAILQDGGKATEMFDRIQSLAVKSPFGIMDLNQYAKQLSAYGIEYNELYDTMKRLADISAGVGVDMGRIILAFGQVKAAGFLKGTELRQFSEANIPVVDKLAEKFTKLTGEMVTAGEVYDMISEKKVTFQDVKDVLWGLTDKGGKFNNMQEVLSESLASKWKNLADAVDVMYGKIAEGGMGDALKGLAETLTTLTKHWDKLVVGISAAGSAFLSKKAAIAMFKYNLDSVGGSAVSLARQMSNLRARTQRELAATSNSFKRFGIIARTNLKALGLSLSAFGKNITAMFTKMFKSLSAAVMQFLPMAVIIGAAETIYYFINKAAESTERIKEGTKAAIEGYDNLSNKIKSIGDEMPKTTAGIIASIKNMESALRDYAPNAGDILNGINKKDEEGNFINNDIERYKLLKKALEDTRKAYETLAKEMEGFTETANKASDGAFDESFMANLKDVSKALENYKGYLNEISSNSLKYESAIKAAAKADPSYAKAIQGKNLKESLALLKDYDNALKAFEEETKKTATKSTLNFIRSIEFLNEKMGEANDDSSEFVKTYKSLLESIGFPLDNLNQQQKIAIAVDITKFMNSIEGLDEETKKLFTQRILEKEFNIKLTAEEKNTVEKRADPYDPSKDEVAKMWKKRSEEIAKAVKMYDQWKKLEGTAKASERVKKNDELSELFSGAYGFKLDLENPTAAYEYIQSKLNKGLSAQKELMIQLGVKISDAELKDAQDKLKSSVEQLKKDTKKIVEGWDLYEDLFKATGNKDVSMKIAFGGNVGFDNLLKHLESQIKGKMNELGIGISFDELIKMDTKSLEEAGFVGLTDLIETYNKENAKLKDESVKNFLEIIKNSKDFAQQIADIDRKLQTDLSDLAKGLGGTGSAEFERRATELIKKAEEDKVKVNFEEFKKSSDWVKVFDDLNRVSDATLDNMTKKIEEFAKQANLSEEVTKQLVDAMGKLRDEAIERNPFEGFVEAWKRLKHLKGGVVTKSGQVRFGSGTEADPFTFKSKEEVDNEVAEANDDLVDSTMGVIKKFDAVADAANLLSGLFENLGVDLGSFGDIIGGATSGAQTGAGIASALGAAGPWGAIAGAAVGMLSQVFAAHDKALEKEIEASEAREKAIKNMAENLEGLLSKNIGGIYTFKISDDVKKEFEEIQRNYQRYLNAIENFNNGKDIIDSYQIIRQYSHLKEDTIAQIGEALSTEKYYDAQKASLMVQRDEIEKQRKAEEEKKKTDANKIADYDQQLREMKQQLKDFALDMANELWGIDFKSWANQLTESLVNAWSKGEDAVLAYKNTVSDILRDLGVSIISQKIIEPLLEDTMDEFLAQFDKDNGELTDNSMKILAGIYEGADKAASATEAYLEGLKKLGVDISETSESSSSGLSKGVQSITENTADLLASYVNSMRVDVSANRTLFEQLVNESVPRMSMLAEAQLTQLRMVADNTRRNADAADRIYELVNRVVDKGSNKLKV